jgi:hypothetical protein
VNEDRRNLNLPDRRENTYEALEERLDNHIEEIVSKFDKWLRRGLLAFSIIALACGAALIGFGINLSGIKDTRREFVRTTCQDTNRRHDQTYQQLIDLSQEDQNNAKTQAQKNEIKRRRDVTLGLIDALAPKQDCERLVRIALGEAKAPPVRTTPKKEK